MARYLLASAVLFCVFLPCAFAEEQTEDSKPTETVTPAEEPSPQGPPPGFDSKRPLSPKDLARKNTGGYFTGLPLANFDPNTGVGFGARAYYYYNGNKDDPFFAYTPYLHRVFAQAFATTKGLQFHWLDYDAPALAGTSYRLRSQLIFFRNNSSHYYGIGEKTLGEFEYTGSSDSFKKFSDYDSELRRVRGGEAYTRYDNFIITQPILLVSVERTFLKGLVRPLLGLGFTYTDIDDYTGRTVDGELNGERVSAPMAETRLSEDCGLGLLVGCDGGWNNFIKLGISFDTRDFEPDPNRGLFLDMALDIGTKALGSKFNYARFLVAARGYVSPFPELADLVLAGRATFQAQSKSAPFFSLNAMPYTENTRAGLGGHRTLRGFQQDRFVGHLYGLLNTELRWTFYRFEFLKQRFALMAAGLLDIGRSFDNAGNLTLKNWQRGQGGSFRVAWNQATVVVVDYAVSDEDTGLYINFEHQF